MKVYKYWEITKTYGQFSSFFNFSPLFPIYPLFTSFFPSFYPFRSPPPRIRLGTVLKSRAPSVVARSRPFGYSRPRADIEKKWRREVNFRPKGNILLKRSGTGYFGRIRIMFIKKLNPVWTPISCSKKIRIKYIYKLFLYTNKLEYFVAILIY